jgi:excisionase family DNA binding protein
MERFADMLQKTRAHSGQWLTVEDVAAELKISRSIVYRIIRNGEMIAINVVETGGRIAQKGHYRIKREWLDKYVESKTTMPIPAPAKRLSSPRLRIPHVKNYLGL